MPKCSIINCTNKTPKLSFHFPLPNNPSKRQAWLAAINTKNLCNDNPVLICSHHFPANAIQSKDGSIILKPGILPTMNLPKWPKVDTIKAFHIYKPQHLQVTTKPETLILNGTNCKRKPATEIKPIENNRLQVEITKSTNNKPGQSIGNQKVEKQEKLMMEKKVIVEKLPQNSHISAESYLKEEKLKLVNERKRKLDVTLKETSELKLVTPLPKKQLTQQKPPIVLEKSNNQAPWKIVYLKKSETTQNTIVEATAKEPKRFVVLSKSQFGNKMVITKSFTKDTENVTKPLSNKLVFRPVMSSQNQVKQNMTKTSQKTVELQAEKVNQTFVKNGNIIRVLNSMPTDLSKKGLQNQQKQTIVQKHDQETKIKVIVLPNETKAIKTTPQETGKSSKSLKPVIKQKPAVISKKKSVILKKTVKSPIKKESDDSDSNDDVPRINWKILVHPNGPESIENTLNDDPHQESSSLHHNCNQIKSNLGDTPVIQKNPCIELHIVTNHADNTPIQNMNLNESLVQWKAIVHPIGSESSQISSRDLLDFLQPFLDEVKSQVRQESSDATKVTPKWSKKRTKTSRGVQTVCGQHEIRQRLRWVRQPAQYFGKEGRKVLADGAEREVDKVLYTFNNAGMLVKKMFYAE